jgi:ABC-type dipeptide/oligopeptide/nickel transport system permease subunit
MRTVASLYVAIVAGTVAAFAGAAFDGIMTWVVYVLVGFVFLPIALAVDPPQSRRSRPVRNGNGPSRA